QDDAPAAFALFQKIVESAAAHNIAQHPIDFGPLRDRHFGLSDRALAFDVDAHSAQHMHDAYASVITFLADADEFLVRTLKPGRPHLTILMPDGAEAIPHSGIAPDCPVLTQRPDFQAVCSVARHGAFPLSGPGLSRPSTSLWWRSC